MSDSDRQTAIATARRGMAKRQIGQDFGIEEVKRGQDRGEPRAAVAGYK